MKLKDLKKNKRIVVGSDRRGFLYKSKIIDFLKDKGYDVMDVGPFDDKYPYDYPIYGQKVGNKIANNEADFGIVICGTGIGISIAANKVKGVRCGIAYSDEIAFWMRQHNNANVIAFGQDFMKYKDVIKRLEIFLDTEFLEGYHTDRIVQITNIENNLELKQGEIVNSNWEKK